MDGYGDLGDANINLPSPPKIVVDLARQIDEKKNRKTKDDLSNMVD